MIIKKEDTNKFENSPKCYGDEYPFKDKDINIAVVVIKEKYPEKGFAMNKEVKEVVLVMNGEGKVVIEGKDFDIKKEDSILILKGQKFRWEGNLKLAVICTPAWWPEQHVIVD